MRRSTSKANFEASFEFPTIPTIIFAGNLTLQSTRGGGGGAFGLYHQIIKCHSKMVLLAIPKFVTFSFYLLGIFWQNLSKISLPRGML